MTTEQAAFQSFVIEPSMSAMDVGRKMITGIPNSQISFEQDGKQTQVLAGFPDRKPSFKLGTITPSKNRKGRYRLMDSLHRILLVPKTGADLGYTLEEAKALCSKIWKNMPEKPMSLTATRKMLVEIRKEMKS